MEGFQELVPYEDWGPVASSELLEAYRVSQTMVGNLAKGMRDHTKTDEYASVSEASEQIGLLPPVEEFMRYTRYHWKDLLTQAGKIVAPILAGTAVVSHFVNPFVALALGAAAFLGGLALFAPQVISGPLRSGFNAVKDYWTQHGQDVVHIEEAPRDFPNVADRSVDPTKHIDPGLDVDANLPETSWGNYIEYVDLYSVPQLPHISFQNTVQAMTSTIDVRLTPPVISVSEQMQAWEESPSVEMLLNRFNYDTWFPFSSSDTEVRSQWEQHLIPAKLRMYEAAGAKISRDDCVRNVEIMLKMGEVYFCEVDSPLKSRIIANVSPAFQYHVGPAVYEVTRRLKDVLGIERSFDVPFIYSDERRVYLTYGAGMTTAELNRWFNHVVDHPEDSFVIAAGDDSVVYDSRTKTFYCSDFSSFDQSESKGPLAFQYQAFSLLGMSEDDLDMLKKLHSAPLKYRNRWLSKHRPEVENYLRIRHADRPFRMSGGPDTTVGNTLVSLASWLHVLAGEVTVQAFQELGFKVKLNATQEPCKCLFLRGRWLDLEGAYYWTPCLGKIVKLGKTKADLKRLFPKMSKEEAVTQYQAQMAECLRAYAWNPVWAALVKGWELPGTVVTELVAMERKYDVVEDAPPTQASDVVASLAHVYDVDAASLRDLIRSLERVAETKTLSSPILVKIYVADYA
jgi:hypothetical protein